MNTPLPQISGHDHRRRAKCTADESRLQPINWTAFAPVEAVYLHVPFCFHKCHYCDFYSIVAPEHQAAARQESFARRIADELARRAGQLTLRPRTVFVGGGTPTLLAPDLWQCLLDTMHDHLPMSQVQEFTVEANPETVTPRLMRVLRDGGVNRVSLGAQSFDPALLKALERWHEPASVARAVDVVREAGIANINLDLIFAIPGQSMEQLDRDIEEALAPAPSHLSYYGLTYESNTAMTARLRMGRVRRVDEDAETMMYRRIIQRLADAGFEHYEISNWARRLDLPAAHWPATKQGDSSQFATGNPKPAISSRCLHNMAYWTNRNWIGLGPSAASHIDGHRWKNDAHLGHYLQSAGEPPIVDHEFLAPDRRVGEQIMLRLRLREGIDRTWLDAALDGDGPRVSAIEQLTAIGMLEETDRHVRLSDRGLLVADSVIAQLL